MDEETKVLTSTLNSFLDYGHTAQLNVIKVRREKLNQLKARYQYEEGGCINHGNQVNYYELASKYIEPLLETLTEDIENNSFFLEAVAQTAKVAFGAPEDEAVWEESTISEISKVVSMLGQISREWSIEGIQERECSMGKVIREIENLFPELEEGTFEFDEYLVKMDLGDKRLISDKLRHQITRNRASVNIVIPGCGLGRLPLELAARGFAAQGNEVSFSMLFTSNFILNSTNATNEYRLNPWIHSFSHVRDRSYQTRAVLVPDIHPAEFLTRREKVFGKPAGELTMMAGSFDEVYPAKADKMDNPNLNSFESFNLERRYVRQQSEELKEEQSLTENFKNMHKNSDYENTPNRKKVDCTEDKDLKSDNILENAFNMFTLKPKSSENISEHKNLPSETEQKCDFCHDCDENKVCFQKSKSICSWKNTSPLLPANDNQFTDKQILNNQSLKPLSNENIENSQSENGSRNKENLKVDVIATVFFIDTSPNIFKTLDTISKTLVKGGYWINFGPLLWHYEHHIPAFEYSSNDGSVTNHYTCDSNRNSNVNEDIGVSGHNHNHDRDLDDRTAGLELSLNEIFDVLPNYGLRIIKQESRIPTTYAIDTMSMRGNMYNCEYWVAIKEV
ncbi:uncharacterized protein SAPINGB_P003278 [Magnusiomyces paraingens]|uniref:Uncharacterized protein n=1 Tax=Magnusiomyces paraingens TaxID=2606893 RepID=A0A5E8BM75_9ASCO|nr:uncharacterized protein SAPINGB_P003278 [Saprochaete ingens]VVT51984.1 unnamed protein product [Saprochaete ingens]